jgi:phosphoglycerate dehydrogenase-like enzyme
LLTPEFLERATNLRWAQVWSAGVDRYLDLNGLIDNEEIVMTNMKGIHGPVIAEHVMATLLALCRDLPAYQRAQEAGEWNRRASSDQRALAGSTLMVVGMGGIGTEVARRAFGFDMRVLATVRTSRPAPSFVEELGTSADFARLLPQADFVVICLPLTPETRGMFDADVLSQMKPDSILINIARGAIVNTDALVSALESGHLAAAALDVTDPEPLPKDHPLWKRTDVIITPHTAGTAALTGTRREILFQENARRFGAGEPLLNVVDKVAGY